MIENKKYNEPSNLIYVIDAISNILKNRDDELALVSLKDQVSDLAVSYQPYG